MTMYDRSHSFNGGPMYSSTTGAIRGCADYKLTRGGRSARRRGGRKSSKNIKRVVIKTKKGRKYTLPVHTKLHEACKDAVDQSKCVEEYRNKKNPKPAAVPAFAAMGYFEYTSPDVDMNILAKTIPDPMIIDVDKIQVGKPAMNT